MTSFFKKKGKNISDILSLALIIDILKIIITQKQKRM